MMEAHEGNVDKQRTCQCLYKSMLDLKANHSLSMWFELISKMSTPCADILDCIFFVATENAFDLVTHNQGVRTINTLLKHYRQPQLQPLLEALLLSDDVLDCLIQDEFANHAVQHAITFAYDRICLFVIKHFPIYAVHPYANYLVQNCINNAKIPSYLEDLANAFILHASSLVEDANHVAVEHIEKNLERTLTRFALKAKLQHLQVCWSRLRWKQKSSLPDSPAARVLQRPAG